MRMYRLPPFCYACILLSSHDGKDQAKSIMKNDMDALLKLERVAGLLPIVGEFLDDVADLFPPAVRVLLETFFRDGFDVGSIDGRRVLSTMLLIVPDMKPVEEFHGKIRAAESNGVNRIVTNGTRTRVCIDSGIIERRGIKHLRVSRADFEQHYHRWSFLF